MVVADWPARQTSYWHLDMIFLHFLVLSISAVGRPNRRPNQPLSLVFIGTSAIKSGVISSATRFNVMWDKHLMTPTLHRMLCAALLLTGLNAMAIEEPKYTVLSK